jgi:hypothetical protein
MANRFEAYVSDDNHYPSADSGNRFDKYVDGTDQPYAPKPPEQSSIAWLAQKADDAVRAIANGATFGGADRLAGAMNGEGAQAEFKRSAEAKERSPYVTTAGTIAGAVAPTAAISKGLGLAIPALGELSTLPIMANQAITGGATSAAEDAMHGEVPDPAKAGISAVLSGGLSGIVHQLGQLFPSNMFRKAGNEMSDADKQAAKDFANKANASGVPVNVAEATARAAPTTSQGVQQVFKDASSSPKGSKVIAEFNAERLPQITESAKKVVESFGPGVKDGTVGKEAGEKAIKSASELVQKSAEPYYNQSARTFVKAPTSAARTEAADRIVNTPTIMERLGNAPKHSIKFLDAVQKEMRTAATNATQNNRGWLGKLIGEDTDNLVGAMDAANPKYQTAREIFEQGQKQLVEPLKAGPVGQVANSTRPGTQAKALFDVGTDEAATAAMDAAKRLDIAAPNTSKGLLSTHVQETAAKDPVNVAKALAKGPGERVAESVNPQAVEKWKNWEDAFSAVNTKGGVVAEGQKVGPLELVLDKARGMGKGKLAKLLTDPNNIDDLGVMGSPEFWSHIAATAASERAAQDSPALSFTVKPRKR